MKRLLFLLAVILTAQLQILAQSFSVGDYYYYVTSETNREVMVSLGNPHLVIAEIPSTVTYNTKTYSVTAIGEYAFNRCSGLTSITIPNSVTTIGCGAFFGCSGLTSITIPNSVTAIGDFAFDGCLGLTRADFGSIESLCKISFGYSSNPLSYAHHLFIDGKEVIKLEIPSSVTNIGYRAFDGCSALTSVTVPNSVSSIGQCAFIGCSGLTRADFGSIESLCKISFEGYCSNPLSYAHHLFIDGKEVIKLEIPSSVTNIGDFAFDGCSALTSVTIPNSVSSIGHHAFDGCSALTSVTVPNSVSSIGDYAFNGCLGLTSVTVPNSVSSIGESAFDGCSNVKELIYAEGCKTALRTWLTSIERVTIPNSVTTIEGCAFYGCSSLASITIPNSVTAIEIRAFDGCSSLTAINIPKSVMKIEDEALISCGNLVSITVEQDNPIYDSRNNCNAIIEKASNTLVVGCKSSLIPNTVTCIGRSAFCACDGLTSITIPSTVKVIDDYAFYECYDLKEIYSLAETPTTIVGSDRREDFDTNAFDGEVYENAVLYVPNTNGAATLYKYAFGWKNFKHIVPMDMSGIDTPTITPTLTSPTYYNLQGQRVTSPQHGINIIGGKKVVK